MKTADSKIFLGDFMKKLFVAIVLLFCLCSLFSKSVNFSGSGTTEEESLLKALDSLSSTVSSEINYISKYSVFDNARTHNQELTTNLTSRNIEIDPAFLSDFLSTEKKDGHYLTTIIFSDENASKIQESATTLVSIIENTAKESVENYIDIFNAWDLYEIISYIAAELSIDIPVPQSDRTILKASFASSLKNEANKLKNELKNTTTKEERRKEINDRLLLLDKISQYYNLNTSINDRMPDLNVLIGTIEEQKASIRALFNKKETQIQYYISQSTTEINAIENEIKDRAWTSFDYDSSGNISTNSKNKREAERQDRVNEVIANLNKEVQTIENLYLIQVAPILETLSENYTALLRSPKYTNSSSSENVLLKIDQYDPEEESWPFSVTMTFPFADVSFEGKIPFFSASQIFETSAVNNDYESRIKAVNFIEATLKSLDNVSMEVSYTVRPDEGASKYCINATLSFKHNDEDFFICREEKSFYTQTVVPFIWRTYSFASDKDQAIKMSEERTLSIIGNKAYTQIIEKTKTEQRGSLFIAKTDIDTNSVSLLIDEINKNNDKLRLIRSSVSYANVSNIYSILKDSENMVSFLNGLGFFFNYKALYNESYISAIYASYCENNNLQNILYEEIEKNISSLEQAKANELINSITYNPQASTEISPFIDEVESQKKEINEKKAVIPQALEEIRTEVEAKVNEECSEIANVYAGETKERKQEEIKAYYENILPSVLYKKESELLSSYDYEGSSLKIKSSLENMKENQFLINSLNSSHVRFSWGQTDLRTGQKYFTLCIQYKDKEYFFTDKINASSLFNNMDPSEMGIELFSSYTEYMKALDYAALSGFFVAEISCTIDYTDVTENSCIYKICLSSLTIRRRDSAEVVYEHIFTPGTNLSLIVDSFDYSIPRPTIEKPEGYKENSSPSIEYFGNSFNPHMSFGLSSFLGALSIDSGFGILQDINRFRLIADLILSLAVSTNSTSENYDYIKTYLGIDVNGLYRITEDAACGLGVMFSLNTSMMDYYSSKALNVTSIFGVFDFYTEPIFFNAKMGVSIAEKASFFVSATVGLNLLTILKLKVN